MPTPFTRTALGAPYPSTCVRCRRKEDLVDLGAQEINGYGAVLLCTVCIGELVDVMGYVARDAAARREASLRDEITALERELAARPTLTDSRYEGLTHAIAALAARHPAGDPDPRPARADGAARLAGPTLVAVPADDAAADPQRHVDDAGRAGGGDAEVADGGAREVTGGDDGAGGAVDPWDVLGGGAADEDD